MKRTSTSFRRRRWEASSRETTWTCFPGGDERSLFLTKTYTEIHNQPVLRFVFFFKVVVVVPQEMQRDVYATEDFLLKFPSALMQHSLVWSMTTFFCCFPDSNGRKRFQEKKGNWTLGGVNRVVHQIKNQAKIYQESSGQSFPGASEERSKIMKKVIPGLLLCGQRKNTMMKRAPWTGKWVLYSSSSFSWVFSQSNRLLLACSSSSFWLLVYLDCIIN